MKWLRRAALACMLAGMQGLPAAAAEAFEPTAWTALLAPGWDPQQLLSGYALDRMSDGDPEAAELLKKLRKLWDAAPPNAALDRRRVRLSGYMVPLDFDRQKIREFLLVPYFGACIHAPAPPANQMVHVVLGQAMNSADRGTSAVSVSGTLTLVRSESELGVASYRLQGDKVEAWKP